MRHYGSHNLPQPPTSSGRVLRIELPMPNSEQEKRDMSEAYLDPYWQGRLLLASIEEVVRTCQWAVQQRLKQRIQADQELPERRRLTKRVAELLYLLATLRQAKREADLLWIDREVVRIREERLQAEEEAREQEQRESAEQQARYAEWMRQQKEWKREREQREREQQEWWEEYQRMLRNLFVSPVDHHYRTLGLEPNAPKEAIKKAYKAQMLRCHPDVASQHGLDPQQAHTLACKVNDAYHTLIA